MTQKSIYFDYAALCLDGRERKWDRFEYRYFQQYKEHILHYLWCSSNSNLLVGRNVSEVTYRIIKALFINWLQNLYGSSEDNDSIMDMALYGRNYANSNEQYPFATDSRYLGFNDKTPEFDHPMRLNLIQDHFPNYSSAKDLLFVNHVSRHTWTVANNLSQVLWFWKETWAYTIFDGAQAFGNIPDCTISTYMNQWLDAYLVSSSKFICAMTWGFAVVSDRIAELLKNHQFSYMLDGKVSKSISLDKKRLKDFLSKMSYYEQKWLYNQKEWFASRSSALNQKRQKIINQINSKSFSRQNTNPSPGILSVAYNSILSQKNTKSLHGFLSWAWIWHTYFAEAWLLRFGLNETVSKQDIDYLVNNLRKYDSF